MGYQQVPMPATPPFDKYRLGTFCSWHWGFSREEGHRVPTLNRVSFLTGEADNKLENKPTTDGEMCFADNIMLRI